MRRWRRPKTRMGVCASASFVLRRPLMLLTKRDWRGAEHIPRDGWMRPRRPTTCRSSTRCRSRTSSTTTGGCPVSSARPRCSRSRSSARILRSAGQIPVYRKTADASKAFHRSRRGGEEGRVRHRVSRGDHHPRPRTVADGRQDRGCPHRARRRCPVIPCAQWGPQEMLAPYARRPQICSRAS